MKLSHAAASSQELKTFPGAMSTQVQPFLEHCWWYGRTWLGTRAAVAFVPDLAFLGPWAVGKTTMEQLKRRVGKRGALVVRASQVDGPEASVERLGRALVGRVTLRLFDSLCAKKIRGVYRRQLLPFLISCLPFRSG
jgi:hypothetical protein